MLIKLIKQDSEGRDVVIAMFGRTNPEGALRIPINATEDDRIEGPFEIEVTA